jgi:hypothetical protein
VKKRLAAGSVADGDSSLAESSGEEDNDINITNIWADTMDD